MKKIRISFAASVLLAFAVFTLAGLNLSFHNGMQQGDGVMNSSERSMPCFFMGETGICLMSPLKHVEQFFDLMQTVVPLLMASLMVLLACMLAAKIFHRFLWRSEIWPLLDKEKLCFSRVFAVPNFQRHKIVAELSKMHPRLYS